MRAPRGSAPTYRAEIRGLWRSSHGCDGIALLGPVARLLSGKSEPPRELGAKILRLDYPIHHELRRQVEDGVIQPEDLRAELTRRFALSAQKARDWPEK